MGTGESQMELRFMSIGALRRNNEICCDRLTITDIIGTIYKTGLERHWKMDRKRKDSMKRRYLPVDNMHNIYIYIYCACC